MDISFALEVARNEKNRRRAEQHVRQLNRVYSVLSGINEIIVRERDSQAMLEAACRIAVDKGQFLMAWIGMIDPATQLLQPVASSGAVDDYLDQIKLNVLDREQYGGPSSQCVHTRKHAICNDTEHDPTYAPWREKAMRHGFRSSAGFPLIVEDRVAGVFNLYAGEPEFFSSDELLLLDEMAMDISYAMEVNQHETDRVKKEEELRWRTAFFEAQLDSSTDGIFVVDVKGKRLYRNKRALELFGFPEHVAGDSDDLLQRNFVASVIKSPADALEKLDNMNSRPDEVSRDEVELIDGKILERCSSPVRDKAGNHYGRIWTLRDITERRQLEEQFRQAQKMEAIGQLTGGIAHDFNNLLTVILGCSEVIGEEAKENPRFSKMAQMILDAARKGAELTHRMLAFARRQALQPRPVDVNRLLVEMQSFLRRTLSADIELNVILGGVDCEALVDPTQLESAILNLCVNARDAMPGGGRLTIETDNTVLDADYAAENADVTPGQYLLVAISDTGCGISPENLSRVFDPFFTTKEVGKGTGLGLSMVYGFMKQSQGHIKIYTELGQGTSVKLYLPRNEGKKEQSAQIPASFADLRGTEVVLLVEDDAPLREFARSELVNLGYRVLEAENGKNALNILAERADVDLLFTDIVMPGGMNGRELGLEARQLNPMLKVLYTSGYAENAIHHDELFDNDVQFLGKPYTRRELAIRIRGIFAGS
jgi:PAS domain S-box-containing protein